MTQKSKGDFWQLNLVNYLATSGVFAVNITAIFISSAFAQSVITPDQNLGSEKSQVIKNYNGNPTDALTGGAIRGQNLFHSFLEFNVSEGRSALFLSPNNNIQNILVRVTGSNRSEILGKLETSGSHANLFLINPHGIVFGANASLNVGGSFVASTASGIKFGDNTIFSATAPQTVPLLTVSVPTGLQFGTTGAEINVQGMLEVPTGKTLALVGGNVTLDGGDIDFLRRNSLKAESGQIALGGILGIGTIGLNLDNNNDIHNQILTFPHDIALADVSLKNQARIDVSGQGGGYIQIQGRRITSTNASQIIADTKGSQSSRGIFIQAEQLTLKDGSQISASVSANAAGSGGDLTVKATDLVEVIGTVPNSKSNAGNPSALFTLTLGAGAGGNLTIETRKLIVQDGGNVSASTREGSQGAGGTLRVIASDLVEVSGTEAREDRENPSGLFTQTEGTGNGGALTIKTRTLIIRGGALVSSATSNQGNGGTITIDASDLVELSGTSTIGKFPSGLFAQTLGEGNAGSLLINTGKLIVQDENVIAVGSTGSGQAGNLEIKANEIHLNGEGRLLAATTSVNGGNIKLQLQNLLLLRNKSQISTTAGTAGSGGNGGNITIDIPNGFIVAVSGEDSDISANAFQGNGGNVQINTFGIFGTEFREKPTNFSDITASSEFGLNGTVEINTPDIEVSPESINLPTQAVEPKLAQVCQGGVRRNQDSFVITGRGGLPSSPTETLKADAVLADWIVLGRVQQTPVNSNVSQNPTSTPASILEATGWTINPQGKIVLTANAPTVTPHNSWQKPTDCSAAQP